MGLQDYCGLSQLVHYARLQYEYTCIRAFSLSLSLSPHLTYPYSYAKTDTADCGETAERQWRNDAQATARHAPHIRVQARLRTCGECTTSSVAQACELRWTVNRVYQHPAPALHPGQSQTRHPAPPPLQDPYSHPLIIPSSSTTPTT